MDPVLQRFDRATRAAYLARAFQDADHARDDEPGAVFHLHYIEWDTCAGIWAVDEQHARSMLEALEALLQLLLDDEELILDLGRVAHE